jgi:hypothetical protein
MGKQKNILFLIFGGALFISVLYWTNQPGSQSDPVASGSGTYKTLLQHISELEQKPWQVNIYSDIKGKIMGASSAGELTETENSSLINLLEIGKTKSLIISFDATQNNDCLNPSGLSALIKELETQQKIVNMPEAGKRIEMYRNLQNFLSLGKQVEAMKNRAYNGALAGRLSAGIRSAASNTGVTECGDSPALMSQWIDQLNTYQKVSISYDYIYNNNSNLPEEYAIECGLYKQYPYYLSLIKKLNRLTECN